MYRLAATTSAPAKASPTIESTTCGSSDPSAIEISTYGARAAAMPAFIAFRTPRPSSLRSGLTWGSSAASAFATGTVVSPSKS